MGSSSKTGPVANPADAAREQAELVALAKRYPIASPVSLLPPLVFAVASNALLFWLVHSARLTPFELALLVLLETLVLGLLAQAARLLVPANARCGKPQTGSERALMFALTVVWVAAVYAVILFAWLKQWPQMQKLIADPLAYVRASWLWFPIAIALLGALIDLWLDWRHWRRVGGLFIVTPAMTGGARKLTLLFGGIPFALPLFLIVIGANQVLETLQARAGRDSLKPQLILPVLVLAVFGAMGAMIHAGVSGFALGYVLAKMTADLFLIFTPWLGQRILDDDADKENPRT